MYTHGLSIDKISSFNSIGEFSSDRFKLENFDFISPGFI